MADWAEVQARLIWAYVVTNDPPVGRDMIREMLWQAYEAGCVAGREVGRQSAWASEVRVLQAEQPERVPDRWVVIHDAGRGECGAILDRDGRCPACLIYPDRDRIDVVQRPIEVGSGG